MDVEFAYHKIFDFLENEDATINLLNPKAGIFFAPELYVVFQVGRLLKTHELKVFGENVEWLRETDLKNGGPSDLIFKNKNGELYVFEFKMRGTIHSYNRDIEKLIKLLIIEGHKIKRRFLIALVDVALEKIEKDLRIKTLNELKAIGYNFQSFETRQERYTRDKISCMLGMWEIK